MLVTVEKGLTLGGEEARWLSAKIPLEQYQQLDVLARARRTSKSTLVRQALDEYLTKHFNPAD